MIETHGEIPRAGLHDNEVNFVLLEDRSEVIPLGGSVEKGMIARNG